MGICICQIFSILSQTKFILGKKICLPVKKLRRTNLPLPLLWFAHLAVALGGVCVRTRACVCDVILNFIVLMIVKPYVYKGLYSLPKVWKWILLSIAIFFPYTWQRKWGWYTGLYAICRYFSSPGKFLQLLYRDFIHG